MKDSCSFAFWKEENRSAEQWGLFWSSLEMNASRRMGVGHYYPALHFFPLDLKKLIFLSLVKKKHIQKQKRKEESQNFPHGFETNTKGPDG
ncbi:hypothetical protein CEXT_67611 [Caerostris extrusa]|uniref:Uncharacterized protein n=1 Tax=Caerostris extrusa TaxID=172846 RepID=A0AAV4MMA2_CAEEX|nr:hypothetical protein CEXT_67611 [Caerostris extrusa]